MPWPSSTTRTSAIPPRWTAISTERACASRLFSTSSFTTDAGRSTTSPAATWLATTSDNNATRLMKMDAIYHDTDPASGPICLKSPGRWRIGSVLAMITVTDSAVKHLRSLLAERDEAAGSGLRIFVENGGCSGMQYGMSFDQPKADDEVAEREGVRVLVDPASASFLQGSVVDYEDSLTRHRVPHPKPQRTPHLRLRHVLRTRSRRDGRRCRPIRWRAMNGPFRPVPFPWRTFSD